MTSIPSRVVIRCTVDDAALAGAYVTVSLPMWAKNPYALLFGPSDDRGVVSVSGDELNVGARGVQAASPMDYASFPAEWSRGIGAEILDAAGIQRLREAIAVWGDDHLPPELAKDLDAYEKRMQPLVDRRLAADVAYAD